MIKIGTRNSKLALWQAREAQKLLERAGQKTTVVPVSSQGDQDLYTPLHQFGTTGVFTKSLDEALRKGQADIAVHSLKDYPTSLPPDLACAAVLPRGSHEDILVPHPEHPLVDSDWHTSPCTIATGSIRRRAQWLSRYPGHSLSGLRGNVQTRLEKLLNSTWKGAIFARAGLQRLGLLPEGYLTLDWMLPAPAQGIVALFCRKADSELLNILQTLSDSSTALCAQVERNFLNTVEGGCSAPVGAWAKREGENIVLQAGVFALDGSQKVCLSGKAPLSQALHMGRETARKVLAQGGDTIMKSLRNE